MDSIFEFIQRTAEPADVGRSWVTIDDENKPQRDPGVFNGVGGISFFLVDYFRRSGRQEALTLAQDAIDWSVAFRGKHHARGLHVGKTGVALAALHKSIALGETTVPEFCLENARVILREPPGPVTDLLGGEASNGLYLLKLWARTRDDEHLRGAERCAAWLDTKITRDELGTHCLVDPDNGLGGFPPRVYLGVAHGISGVAHFLACLAEATQNERWAALARELFDTVVRYAQPIHGGLNWSPCIDNLGLVRCQWSHGAAGIGLTLLTAHRVLGDVGYLESAVAAAEATYHYGDFRQNYTQCTGLAGGGELLLEAYRATDDARWKERAREFALQCLPYKESTPDGDAWPTDAPGLYSADFDYGASGVGHFLLRVLDDGATPLPLM
ncbi:MAG: lanthionine synthetase LanC family protein [Chthoniobacteraceae bacterium]